MQSVIVPKIKSTKDKVIRILTSVNNSKCRDNDERLVAVFDKISHEVNDFYYGRYDIMCESIEALKNGTGYTILEYNGCGAEPNHFYDTGYTLINAYREILKHWKALYTISKYNVKQGVKPWPLMKGIRFRIETKEIYAIMKKADEKIG